LRGARFSILILASGWLASCGSGGSTAPTPTPTSVLAQQYLKAADKSNKAEDTINSRLAHDCLTLDPCKQDFAEYSRIETAFNTEIRAMRVPTSMEADLRALLDIDRRRLSLLDDAAQATSLDQINRDFGSLLVLDNQFGDAVDHVRLDLDCRLHHRAAQ
jgi:hypothetical protein